MDARHTTNKLTITQVELLYLLITADRETDKTEIEVALLELVGLDYSNGYQALDVKNAATLLKPLFGAKFDYLWIK